MNRGKLLILLMIAAGVAAGTLKVWKQHRHMDQVLANLTPAVVRLIAEAPQVELLRLEVISDPENAAAGETLTIEGNTYRIADRRNVIGTKGLADVRDRLVDDASYDWKVECIEHGVGTWSHVLQFSDGDQRARLAFDLPAANCGYIRNLKTDQPFVISPIADGLATFFAAQFEEAAARAK